MVGGTNIWGYRGPVAKQLSDGEYRILLVGGTRAYGYGAAADGTIAYALGWQLTGELLRPVNVINAAAMGATAPDFTAIVSRHLALAPDLVCLYDDLGRASGRRRESRVARIARGYTPILPLVLEEKGMAWRYGSVARGYAGEPPTAGWPRRMAGAWLQWVGSSLSFLDSEMCAVRAGRLRAANSRCDRRRALSCAACACGGRSAGRQQNAQQSD